MDDAYSDELFSSPNRDETTAPEPQIPLEQGRFNGRIFVPYSSPENSSTDEEESTRPVPKKPKSLTPRNMDFSGAGPSSMSDKGTTPKVSMGALTPRSASSTTPKSVRERTFINTRKENRPPNSIPFTPPTPTCSEDCLLHELKKTNELLVTLVARVDKTERRVKALENSDSSSSSTPKRSSRKKEVPLEVRRETRRVYGMLLEEDEEFNGWSIEPGVTFKDAENKAVLRRLVREVKGLCPEFLAQHIHDAAYRYYRTQCEESSAKRRGKVPENLRRKRRHERLSRKLQERKAALAVMTMKDEKHRDRWQKVLHIELMSSEESCEEDEDTICVKPLPWRSQKFEEFLQRLDSCTSSKKSSMSKRQSKNRIVGDTSTRPQPGSPSDIPAWVFAKH